MITLPTVDAMTWLEESLYYGLLSCDLFASLNVVLERKFQMEQEVQRDAIWMTQRGGCTGAGAFVEMPAIRVDKPNSQVNDLVGGVVIFEERNTNLTAGVGTQVSSEQWAATVAEFMRGWILGQAGGLVIEPAAVSPANDFMSMYPGIICYRASVRQRLSRTIIPRCDNVVVTDDGGLNVTLANGALSPDADIYCTFDGSFPGQANPAAALYAAPFPVPSGSVVQAAAYKAGNFLPSHVAVKTVT